MVLPSQTNDKKKVLKRKLDFFPDDWDSASSRLCVNQSSIKMKSSSHQNLHIFDVPTPITMVADYPRVSRSAKVGDCNVDALQVSIVS